jgi:hypothetical protein
MSIPPAWDVFSIGQEGLPGCISELYIEAEIDKSRTDPPPTAGAALFLRIHSVVVFWYSSHEGKRGQVKTVNIARQESARARSFWVITSYFNWCRFASKLSNYQVFSSQLKAHGLNLLTVECALFGEPFHLPASRDVIQVRTSSIMWQKERLLNVGLESLPRECRFVAWIDCDLLFQNASWYLEAADALETFGVVQLFEQMVRLPRGSTRVTERDTLSLSFMGGLRDSVTKNVPARLGHPGFAWAARRDVLEACDGLYDGCIVGGADRVMAHAWFGDYHSPIVREIAMGQIWPHYQSWATNAHRVVRGSVSSIAGVILHLWHGESTHRGYFKRHEPVAELGFNPTVDLMLNSYGCWEWSRDKPELQEWMQSYFESRREDG